MIAVLVDTSVLVKWFHEDGESEVAEARMLRDAHLAEHIQAVVLDLAFYEVGNVMVRAIGRSSAETAAQLDDLELIVGPPVTVDGAARRDATEFAVAHRLSFYDACWTAAARHHDMTLVSADRRLIASGLAESATSVVARLGLRAR